MIHPELGPMPNPLERFPPRRITVPVDLTEDRPPALEAALKLARRWKARVNLIHVNEPPPPSLLENVYIPRGFGEEDRFYRNLQYRVRALAGDYPDVKVRIEDGYPKMVLTELAESGEPHLIVMGTRGRDGLSHVVLGSVAEAVVRAARTPVMTVRDDIPADWPRKILVPMKQASYADLALRYALCVAGLMNAELAILHCPENRKGEESSWKPLQAHLIELLGKERLAGMSCLTTAGRPAEAVLAEAARGKFDLVVLAAHRKPFLEDLILGTTAERVLRHSPVPVLSIPSITAPALAAAGPARSEEGPWPWG